VRSGSTEEFEPAPYVFTLLNALLWLYYGATKPDGLLVATVNGFGAAMEAIYVVLFIVYAANHATRVRDHHTYFSLGSPAVRVNSSVHAQYRCFAS
jgi:solute carrier family 50 (sugar transporter)